MSKCTTHYVDNQGLCHRCGKPMNMDYWLGSIGPEAYCDLEDKLGYRREWHRKVMRWEELNNDE
jgi:hypothetical protein